MKSKLSLWLQRVTAPSSKQAANSTPARSIGKLLFVLGLAILSAIILWRGLLYRDVARQFAHLRAARLPVSGAELTVWRGIVPDQENGALILTQAFALHRTFPDSRSNEVMEPKLLNRTNDWSPSTIGLIQAYVQTNSTALAKLQDAFRLSRFRYPIDFSYGPEILLPHLGGLKEMARIAALQGALHAEERRSDEWPEDVRLGLKLARTLDDEPLAISYLVRNSIIRMAVQATERCLNRVTPGDEACQKLQLEFTRTGETNLLPATFAGERATIIPTFRMSWKEMQGISQKDDPGSPPRKAQHYLGKPAMAIWLTGFFERDLNFFLQTMDKCENLARLSPPENLALTKYIDHASAIAQKRYYILSSMLLPAYSNIELREASTRARIRLALTALAVERFRLAEGHLPAELSLLTPRFLNSVPADPFDGHPIRYKRLNAGYTIYSVDADGHDDGGREAPERKKATDKTMYDITFTVER